jgi:hypothetical protein
MAFPDPRHAKKHDRVPNDKSIRFHTSLPWRNTRLDKRATRFKSDILTCSRGLLHPPVSPSKLPTSLLSTSRDMESRNKRKAPVLNVSHYIRPVGMVRVSQVHVSCTKVPKSCLSTTERSKAWPFPYGSLSLVIVSRTRRLYRIALVLIIIIIVAFLLLALLLCFIRHDHRVEIGDLRRINVSDDINNTSTCASPTHDKTRWKRSHKSMGSNELPRLLESTIFDHPSTSNNNQQQKRVGWLSFNDMKHSKRAYRPHHH